MSRLDTEKLPSVPTLPEPLARVGTPTATNGSLRTTAAVPSAVWRSGALTVPPANSGTDTSALLKALARRWPLALVLGLLLGGAGAAAAWYLLAAPYTAFAQVRVASNQQPIMMFKSPEEGRSEFLTYLRTQAKHLKSRFVLSEALKRDEVKGLSSILSQPDPLIWLEDELTVESQEGSEFISVFLRGKEPDELTALVNAVIRAYEKEVIQAENLVRSQRIDKLDKEYNERSSKLRQKKESLKQMAKDLGFSDTIALTQKQVALLSSLSELRKQHGLARTQVFQEQLRLDSLKTQEPKMPELPTVEAAVNEALDADPDVKLNRKKIEHYEEIVADYEKRSVNKNDPDMRKAKQEVEKLQKKVAERREKLQASFQERQRAEVQSKFDKAKSEYDALRPSLEKTVDILTKEEKRLRDELETTTKEAEKIGGDSSTTLELLKLEVGREAAFVDELGKNRDFLGLEQNRPPRVTVFQEAALQRHDLKRQIMSAILAAIAGLAFACLAVSWLECRVRRIHTADEVTTGLGLRVVGAVPPTAPAVLRLHAAAEGNQADEHHFFESIDGIRTMLLRDARAGGLRLVMVTSAVSGEGKTTLASHLAGSLARAGRRTLLVDCDLRRPSAHQLFEIPSHPGLSEVLLGEVPVSDAVRQTTVPGLWLLPAGQWDRAVLRALAGEELQKVFAALRQHYDFLIIDSHPVLQAADSLLIGLHVDAVILALMRDLSRMPRVSTACQRLADLGIPVLGAVVNGLPEEDVPVGRYQYAAPPVKAAS